MRTLVTPPTPGRLRRDLRLVADLAAMLFGYWIVGGSLRRRYRRKQARGETFWVDEEGPSAHREAPLAHER